jgi:hypothetical protein
MGVRGFRAVFIMQGTDLCNIKDRHEQGSYIMPQRGKRPKSLPKRELRAASDEQYLEKLLCPV